MTAAELPLASGPLTVSGGEVIALRGATVTVLRVVYVDAPAPAGTFSLHAGVIKQVQFGIARAGERDVTVRAGSTSVEDEVEVKVLAVREGPVADIEVSVRP